MSAIIRWLFSLTECLGALPQTPPETLSLDSARKLGFLDLLTLILLISYEIDKISIRGLGPAAPVGVKGRRAPYGSLRVKPSGNSRTIELFLLGTAIVVLPNHVSPKGVGYYMRGCLDCVPCYIRQALDAGRLITDDVGVQEEIVASVMEMLTRTSFSKPSPYVAQQIHRIIRKHTGIDDPYSSLKQKYNNIALGYYPKLKKRVNESTDRFNAAVRLAIAGNVIDFGVTSGATDIDVISAIDEACNQPIPKSDILNLENAIQSAEKILYIADNSGEIVFDRILIEQMPVTRITVVVRGKVVINDATIDDARAVGLSDVVNVVGNGSDAPGTILSDCSDEVKELFEEADIVIAKGQGNYESLSDSDKVGLFFLLKVKCPVIARNIGADCGEYVVRPNCRP